jgi:4-aminobutyrate aminotransferase and related aminotransferases
MEPQIYSLKEKTITRAVPHRDPIIIKRAYGTKIEDINGNIYIDLYSGISTNNLGHCHPEVVEAIVAQVKQFMHISATYYHYNEVMLAEKLLEMAPKSLSKVFFCNSGNEAVDSSVKFCKIYSRKKGKNGLVLISLEGSFHGRFGLTLSLTGQRKFKKNLGNYAIYPGIIHAPCPYYYRYGEGLDEQEFGIACADKVAEIIDHYTTGDVAAVIAEPILGEGGIIVPPDTYLPRLAKICKEREIPIIIDEVQTGFGRTGKIFACEHWNILPDVMALAKALGGGLPLGAVLISEKIDEACEPGDHFNTFYGNPVSCAAAIATINVLLRERLYENAQRMGSLIIKGLKEEQEKFPFVGDVRGKGLMIGIEIVKDKTTKEPAPQLAEEIKIEMRKRGFLIGVGGIFKNVVRIQPPLIINEEETQKAINGLIESFKKIYNANM